MSTLAQFTPLIEEQMERWGVPGLAVGLLVDGVREGEGYGVASVLTRQPVIQQTIFQVGSISKVFTTTLVMTLVDEGVLDLDRPVIEWVPDLPLQDENARRTITLRHLLTHMAGFYGDRFEDQGIGDDALARAVANFGDLPQQSAPGELWTYCNAGFDLAGRVVEIVTGQPFEVVMRDRVFTPLALPWATYFAADAIRHPVSVGHVPAGEGWQVANPWPIPRRSNPAGGVTASVDELLTFAEMHMAGGESGVHRVLSPAATGAMATRQVDADYGRSWGLGWSIRQLDGAVAVEHNGATNGFTARLTTVPERGFALAILTNGERGAGAHGAISAAILDQVLGLKDVPAPAEIEMTPEQLDRFSGTWKHGLAELTMTPADGGLRVTRVNHNPFSGETEERSPFTLRPVGDYLFRGVDGDLKGSYAEFIPDGAGGLRCLRLGGRLGFRA